MKKNNKKPKLGKGRKSKSPVTKGRKRVAESIAPSPAKITKQVPEAPNPDVSDSPGQLKKQVSSKK